MDIDKVIKDYGKKNNTNLNRSEFGTVRKDSGLNSFSLSPSQWIGKTNAIRIRAANLLGIPW